MLNGTMDTGDEEPGVIPDYVMPYIYTINLAIICGLLSLFGIVTNSFNIVVFLKQNFRETINISLLGLAISDLASLIALLWVSICYNPLFMYSNTFIFTIELQHFTGGWTHVIFTRVTVFITVFITLERCLCIVFPLKVKNILTPKRVTFTVIAIYVIIIGTMCKLYFGFHLDWKYVPSRNRTLIGNVIDDRSKLVTLETASFYLQSIYLFLSFAAIVLCSCLLTYKLNQRGKWRLEAISNDKDSRAALRDRQVIKMVTYLAVIFIASYTPSLILFIVMTAFPDINMDLKNQNLFILSYSISFPFAAINSGVNIFVYYRTSSKFRNTFQSMFFTRFRKDSKSPPGSSNHA